MATGGKPLAALSCLLLLAPALSACPGNVQRGERLLEDGRPKDVLRTVRPVSAGAYVVRAAALRRLGQLDRARTELLLAIALDEQSVDAYGLLGLVEVGLGRRGAAVAALERSLALDPRPVCTRRLLARLLVWRAWYRAHRDAGLLQLEEAKEDLEHAAELSPCLAPRAAELMADVEKGGVGSGTGGVGCPGLAAVSLTQDRPARRGPCRIERADRLVRDITRRELLLGCRAPRLGLRLEDAGCTSAARRLWMALARETPSDPRWPLQVARMHLLEGHPRRAEPLVTAHVYLSKDRAGALLRAASMYVAVGRPRSAARMAVDALPHAADLDQQLAALDLLRRTGPPTPSQLRQAVKVVEEAGWKVSTDRLRELLKRYR